VYPSIERIHTKDGRRIAAPQPRLAKPASPPVAERFTQPFACALPLPAIPSTVPSRYEIRHDLKKTVQALLAFLDLGMVSETDLVEPCQSETEVLRRAFNRFIDQEGSGITLFSPRIVIADSLDENEAPEPGEDIQFCFYSTSMESLFIGNRTAHIEKACPGLGETLLFQIEKALCATFYCVTPERCLDLARYIYWQGEDDERQVVEEMLAEGENPDTMEIYRRSDYLAHLPDWAAESREKLSTDRLREIACTRKGLVKDAAQAALDLAEQHIEDYRPPHFDEFVGDNIDPALYVRWSENDDVGRVFDDFYHYVIQSECTEMHGYLSSKPDTEGIGKALEDIRQFFRILRALEKAFSLIGEQIEEG